MEMLPGTVVEDADGVYWFLGDLGWYQLPLTGVGTDAMSAPPMREPIRVVREGWRS